MVSQRAIGVFFTSSGDDRVGVARWRAFARKRKPLSRVRLRRDARRRVTSHRWISRRGGVAIRGERAEMLRRVHLHMHVRRRDDAIFRQRTQFKHELARRRRARHLVDVSVFKRSLIAYELNAYA